MRKGKKIVIGVAGSIGSGKTTVSRIFESMGARYISADEIGWGILPGITGSLKSRFGKRIMSGQRLDRKRLRRIVFSNQNHLQYLNDLTHPILTRKIIRRVKAVKSGIVVIDAALLFDWPEVIELIDYPILVKAEERIKAKRALAKGVDHILFKKIRGFQKDDDEVEDRARFVIDNNGSFRALKKRCSAIYKEIKDDC